MNGDESFTPPQPAQGNPPSPDESKDSRLHIKLELAPGTRLHVSLEPFSSDGTALEPQSITIENPAPLVQPEQTNAATGISRTNWQTWPVGLIGAGLAVYLILRLVGLTAFPIFFFTDEAIQTVTASDLIQHQFRGPEGEFLPTYFKNGGQYNLSLSVYLQVLPTWLFGKSVFVTRAVSAFISLLAALAVGLALKNSFGSRSAWAGVLLLAVTPAWFLHSRTAFETVLAVSFYAAFLYCYLMYRQGRFGYLYAAVGFGALTFYSYSPAQLVVGVTAVLLLFSDLRYHWQQRKILLRGFILALVLLIPYLRFQINHPGETLRHLTILDSYWVLDMPLREKLLRFGQEYMRGINPLYWYDPTPDGLVRHIMKGYGYLWLPALPLTVLGLILTLVRLRKPEYRVVLASLLAAPAGAALVGLGITRLLFMVIPAVLLGGIGFSAALEWLVNWLRGLKLRQRVFLGLSVLLFTGMAAAGGFMLRDALVSGPTWFDDYGLGGMQYGGDTLFSAVRDYLAENPQADILLSPSWANGTDVIARFFFKDPIPFRLGSIEGHLAQYTPIQPNQVFILLPEELKQVQNSGKFKEIDIDQTVDYPNGQPGFFFTRLTYVDNAQAVFASERQQRQALKQETVTLPDGTPVTVEFSQLDMGEINLAFDGDPASLVRTYEANPFKLNITFAEPRTLSGLRLRIGGVATRVSALVYVAGEKLPRSFSAEAGDSVAPQNLDLNFFQPRDVSRIQLEILSIRDQEPAHVHLWEVTFR